MDGGKNRNRAVHGDVVVVELLPKSEWRGKVTALTEGQGEEKGGEGNESQPMPTGDGGQNITTTREQISSVADCGREYNKALFTLSIEALASPLVAVRGENNELLAVPQTKSLISSSTGRVVGILQRNWRDYVVTFPPRDGTQSQSRNSQRILAVPWDRRIPKIRISTQQADALQVWFIFMWQCSISCCWII